MELRLQPKIGRLAHQAAVDLGSAGWAKSSREQAPAYYTSARQANRRETDVALRGDQGSHPLTCCKTRNSLTGTGTEHRSGGRATHTKARSTEAAQVLPGGLQSAANGQAERSARPPVDCHPQAAAGPHNFSSLGGPGAGSLWATLPVLHIMKWKLQGGRQDRAPTWFRSGSRWLELRGGTSLLTADSLQQAGWRPDLVLQKPRKLYQPKLASPCGSRM